MKRLDAGVSGSPAQLSESAMFPGDDRWSKIVAILTRGRSLRPVQRLALEDARVLDSRQHLVVCAPTNSGKSLVGYLILVGALLQGRRAVLLEPLRALAQEQADELSELLAGLAPKILPRAPKVRISTGDYRLEGELPSDAPPGEGEVIVATPERLDAILRNPANAPWIESIGAVVIDEAHLLSDRKRGPTLELLAASMLSLPSPPRLALLSATVGEPERLIDWLKPCQLVTSPARTPLKKQVLALEAEDDADEVLTTELRTVFSDPTTAAIVFVYRRSSTETLATKLASNLCSTVQAYHSGQSAAERARIRERFHNGSCRCVVTTTALAMGVNLPATHVFVRDTTFFGFGRLRSDELLQIVGRAGRGDRHGVGTVLVRASDDWKPEELADALRRELLPPLRSSFDPLNTKKISRDQAVAEQATIAASTLVATCLARASDVGLSSNELSTLLGNTLGGQALASRVDGALRLLEDSSRLIAYHDDQKRYRLTALGVSGIRSMLPVGYIAGFGQLVRDLISLDVSARLLGRWSAFDHLFLIALLSARAPKLRRFSERLAEQIDGWFESRPGEGKSLLFGEWVMGAQGSSKADELFGSLGIADGMRGDDVRKRAYVAMLGALVLDERSRGVSVSDLESRWGINGLEGVEESWRDTALWLLAGHAAILDVRSFYHHLRENCSASDADVKKTKTVVGGMRSQAYDLLDRLKYCSPLGPLARGIKATPNKSDRTTVGVRTIRTLEAAGITSLQQIATMNVPALVATGVQRRLATQIRTYMLRRLR